MRTVTPLLAAAILLTALARAASAWSDGGHYLVTQEAVQRLPAPLRDLLAGESDLRRIQKAATGPDQRAKRDSPNFKPDERVKHYLDIDAITTEPYPFKNFPRTLAGAEKEFGADKFKEFGRAPWAIRDAFEALTTALAEGRTEDVFRQAGDLAHYGADVHMPLHSTRNYEGQLTGNNGIHAALEIGLYNRRPEFYTAEIQKGRTLVPYMDDIEGPVIEWILTAHGRIPPILEADAAARRKTNYNPAEHKEDLDDTASDRAKPYYEALKAELEARGSPEAVAMREAAQDVARLLYTSWVRAGKPLSLTAPPVKTAETPTAEYWLIGMTVALVILMLLPRRRPTPTPPKP